MSIVAVKIHPKPTIQLYDLKRISNDDYRAVSRLTREVPAPFQQFLPRLPQLSPNGDEVAVVFEGSNGKRVFIFRTSDLQTIASFDLADAYRVQWSPDEERVIVDCNLATYLVELKDPKPVRLPGNSLARYWGSDGKTIFTPKAWLTFSSTPSVWTSPGFWTKYDVKSGLLSGSNLDEVWNSTIFKAVAKKDLYEAMEDSFSGPTWGPDGFVRADLGFQEYVNKPIDDLIVSASGSHHFLHRFAPVPLDTISWINPFTVGYLGTYLIFSKVQNDAGLALYDVRARRLKQFGVVWPTHTVEAVAVPRPK